MPFLRDILLRFTTAAFVVQLLVPFFAVYGVSASHVQAALANPEMFGDKVLICTSNGFEYVSWESLAEDENIRNSQHKNMKCPTCYVQAKAMDVPQQLHVPSYDIPTAQRIAIIHDACVANNVARNLHVRGPPIA